MLYTLYNHKIQLNKNLDYLGFIPVTDSTSADIEVKFSGNANKKKDFLDNQFELKPDYGFYYREKIGFFEFLDGKVIKTYLEGDADTTFFQTLLNFPLACIFAQNGLLPIHGLVW